MSTSARELAVRALEGRTLTRMPGRPTMRAVNKTRNGITAEYAKVKMTYPNFPLGTRFGFAAATMKPACFIRLHGLQVQVGDELNPA